MKSVAVSNVPGALALLLTASCLTAGAQTSEAVRDGNRWKNIVRGTEKISPAGKLKVSCAGSIRIQGGGSGDSIEYTVTFRVKAKDAPSAMRLSDVKVSRAGEFAQIRVGESVGRADLQLIVPKTLKTITVSSNGGLIDVRGVEGAIEAGTGGGNMTIENIGGDVDARSAGGTIVVSSIGGRAKCRSAGGSITATSVKGAAILETMGGDLIIDDIGGELRGGTAGGNIRVRRTRGAVSVHTSGGLIELEDAKSTVRLASAGGSIKVRSASGVTCDSAAGGISLESVAGAIRANTAVGSIFASLMSGAGLQDSFISTASGDITITIPSSLAVTVRAQADAGRKIVSEFPGISVRSDGGNVIGEGSLNGGGPLLRIAGTSGAIYLKRQ